MNTCTMYRRLGKLFLRWSMHRVIGCWYLSIPSLSPHMYIVSSIVVMHYYYCTILTTGVCSHWGHTVCGVWSSKPHGYCQLWWPGKAELLVHVLMEVSYKLLSSPPNCFLCADYRVGYHFLSDSHTIEGSPSRHLITTNHWLAWSEDPSAYIASPQAIMYRSAFL